MQRRAACLSTQPPRFMCWWWLAKWTRDSRYLTFHYLALQGSLYMAKLMHSWAAWYSHKDMIPEHPTAGTLPPVLLLHRALEWSSMLHSQGLCHPHYTARGTSASCPWNWSRLSSPSMVRAQRGVAGACCVLSQIQSSQVCICPILWCLLYRIAVLANDIADCQDTTACVVCARSAHECQQFIAGDTLQALWPEWLLLCLTSTSASLAWAVSLIVNNDACRPWWAILQPCLPFGCYFSYQQRWQIHSLSQLQSQGLWYAAPVWPKHQGC